MLRFSNLLLLLRLDFDVFLNTMELVPVSQSVGLLENMGWIQV